MFKVGDTVKVEAVCKIVASYEDHGPLVSVEGLLEEGETRLINAKFCTLIASPLKVGDAVRWNNGDMGTISAIGNFHALVSWKLHEIMVSLSDLTRIKKP